MIKKTLKQLLHFVAVIRGRYVSQRNFLILLCILTGVIAGVSAVALKRTAIFFEELLNETVEGSFIQNSFFLFPIIGIVLTVIVARGLFKNRFDSSVSTIIYSIAKRRSYLDTNNIWGNMITSALTVSMGGSVGLEAPIVGIGSSIGSNVGRGFRVTYEERTLLLASGAAAGLAAIFNCPISGVIFALEVLLFDFSIPFVIPLILSAATASVISQILYPEKFFFPITESWSLEAIPFYIMLGVGVGLLSVYMIRFSLRIEKRFTAVNKRWKRVAIGGLSLCLVIFLFPALFGEGYVMVENLLEGADYKLLSNSIFSSFANNGWLLLGFAAIIMMLKMVSAAFTIGAGGNGGIFAPSMFTGAMAGFVFSRLVNLTGFYSTGLNESNFIVAGMAGIIAGVVHAPLTGIFLIAEVTGGYALFIPLMIVTSTSYFVTRYFERFSIYHKTLAEEKGIDFKHRRVTGEL